MNAVIDVLATYRLTRLITQDTLLDPYRNAAFQRLSPHDSHLHTYLPNPSYIITCPHCTSVYAAVAVQFLPRPLRAALAAAAVVSLATDYLPPPTPRW